MPPGPPHGISVLHTLGKYFPERYKRCLGSGLTASALTVAYALNALELVPFVRVELQLSAWYQVCCTFRSGLLGPMLQSYPPGDKGENLMGLVPVACTTLLTAQQE
jgi:hypothetical protein